MCANYINKKGLYRVVYNGYQTHCIEKKNYAMFLIHTFLHKVNSIIIKNANS